MYGFAVLVVCGLYVALALFCHETSVENHREQARALRDHGHMWADSDLGYILPGQLYHQYLCRTEGGVKVFKTIKRYQGRTFFQMDSLMKRKYVRTS